MKLTEPLFSVVTPVYDPPADVLRQAIESVRAQTFTDWELLLVDDASPSAAVRDVLAEAARSDDRIRVEYRKDNGGIVAATNDALRTARGEWVAFLDHDDLYHPDALAKVAEAIGSHPDADYVYTDEDKIDEDNVHRDPFLKPDWSPERFRAQMYTTHLSCARRSLIEEVGGMREGYDGAQDWDLVLRVTERARRVVHVPEVLYHWRMLATSVAGDSDSKPYAYVAAQAALQDHVERMGIEASVEPHPILQGSFRLRPELRDRPLVSIVIPTGGTRRMIRGRRLRLVENCLRKLVENTTYQEWEAICVVDTPYVPEARQELAFVGERLRIVEYKREFNFSDKCNVGALHARGELLLLLNDDIEPLEPKWLEYMVAYSTIPDVGIVGAKLLFGDGRIQHTGIASVSGNPGHAFYGFPGDFLGYFGNAVQAGNWLAVTGACLLTPKATYEAVGGMSLTFPVNYNDVDYCLKVWSKGQRVALATDALLTHLEHSTREGAVSPAELSRLRDRWASWLDRDPFYHRGFVTPDPDFVPPAVLRDGTLV
ncbi:MAG: glycosyltransferase family 2 protein [Acidimicrobiia bacterium]